MFTYRATVLRVVDGDTIDVSIDLGFSTRTDRRLRLAGIDTPERGHPRHEAASSALRSLIEGKLVSITTSKGPSKWGYYLASIRTDDGIEVNDWMVVTGMARRYAGGHKEPWPDAAPACDVVV